ncbi:MAG: crossover junction endodeoxyribonuclease RuvC [Caldilineales bacterium]|nr:crossover junction endodeoxyribonuclease RuvC [Caldilineales bacterium]
MSQQAAVILGIDPGIAITGYGIIVDNEGEAQARAYGVLLTPADEPLPARLARLYEQLRELIALHRPTAVAVEELFFARNARTALTVGHARGVVLLAVAQAGLPLYQYKPAEVKLAITGYGGADKRQIQEMVRLLLGLETVPKPDDAADALALALCHFHSHRFQALAPA